MFSICSDNGDASIFERYNCMSANDSVTKSCLPYSSGRCDIQGFERTCENDIDRAMGHLKADQQSAEKSCYVISRMQALHCKNIGARDYFK